MSKTVKKGRLSVAETFYIEGNVGAKSVEQIAKDLNRSVSVVQKVVDAIPAAEVPSTAPQTLPMKDEADDSVAHVYDPNKIIENTRVRHRNGRKIGAIMTEAASVQGERVSVKDGQFVSKNQPKPPNRLTDGAIHRPLG